MMWRLMLLVLLHCVAGSQHQLHEDLQQYQDFITSKVGNERARCVAQGNITIKTLDGAEITFQGKCVYNLMSTKATLPKRVPGFKVFIHNAEDKNTHEAYIQLIHIEFMFNYITFKNTGDKWLIEVNEFEEKKLERKGGEIDFNHNIKVEKEGKYDYLIIDNILMVVVGKREHSPIAAVIPLNNDYKQHLEGICGNWNGNAKDDFNPKGSNKKHTGVELANSWITDDAECL